MSEYKMSVITDESPNFSRELAIEILKIVKRHDISKITTNADGSRIPLHTLPDSVINTIYNLVCNRLKIKMDE